MKKSFKELTIKTAAELTKEVDSLKAEIVKSSMESKSNPQKDTNIVSKKKIKLAMIQTAIQQKKDAEVSPKK